MSESQVRALMAYIKLMAAVSAGRAMGAGMIIDQAKMDEDLIKALKYKE